MGAHEDTDCCECGAAGLGAQAEAERERAEELGGLGPELIVAIAVWAVVHLVPAPVVVHARELPVSLHTHPVVADAGGAVRRDAPQWGSTTSDDDF